jgi:hypothetical protein
MLTLSLLSNIAFTSSYILVTRRISIEHDNRSRTSPLDDIDIDAAILEQLLEISFSELYTLRDDVQIQEVPLCAHMTRHSLQIL